MEKYLLGIDNGLTAVKAVIFDLEGNEIGVRKASTHIDNSVRERVETDMNRLWTTTSTVIREVIAESFVDPDQIAAVGNSAHGNGLYLLDNEDKPMGPAILPMDSRARSILEVWDKNNVFDEVMNYTLQTTWCGQPAPILRWLKDNEPEYYNRIGSILLCKDWIKYKLTGCHTTDYSDISASGLFDNNGKKYDSSILELYGIKEIHHCLPEVLKSHEVCGYVSEAAARQTGLLQGTPVVSGVFDVNACSIGSGVIDSSRYNIIAGTWSINTAITETPMKSKELVQCTIFADGAKYMCINSSAASAVNLDWFLNSIIPENFKGDYNLCEEIVGEYGAGGTGIVFLPYIYGSVVNSGANGAFFGLGAQHTWKDMLRSIYEGIAFEHKRHLAGLRDCGIKIPAAAFSGGAAQSRAWCRIFADILGIRLDTVKTRQSGALGAAITAGIGTGVYRDIVDGVAKTVRKEETYLPDKKSSQIYESKYAVFTKMVDILGV